MRSTWKVAAVAATLTLTLAACGGNEPEPESADSTVEDVRADDETESADGETPLDTSDLAALAEAGGVESIGFVGFWTTNSFTQAVLAGVEEAATEAGIEVTDLSPPSYDAAAQASTVQDATVSGDYDMLILLAADSVGILTPVEDAIDAGITVVAAFVNLGSDFSSLEPPTEGLVVVAETPVANGGRLAELALMACGDRDPCNVAYLEGFAALPLDAARTEAFAEEINTAPNATLVASVEGGYSPDSGEAAAQDVLQANPDVDVMVGSSQAILGAQNVVDTSEVELIGNGASIEAHEAVLAGEWFAHYNLDIQGIGYESVASGLEAAAGLNPEPVDISTFRNPLGTADVIADNEPSYSDLG